MIKNTGKVLYRLFLTFLILTAGTVAISALKIPGNIKFLVVESGSMEPSIKTGSILLIKPQSDYKVGDIITVYDSANHDVSITHRITEIKDNAFITKGDANNSADTESRQKENIAGKAVLSVPFIGHIIDFAKTKTGLLTLIIVPSAIIIYNEILSIKSSILKLTEERKRKPSKNRPKNSFKSFRLNKLLILLFIFSANLFSVGQSRAYYISQITTNALMTAATWETPVNLNFYRQDATHVAFRVSGVELKAYDSLDYLITYDTDQTLQAIPGVRTIRGATEITEDNLFLGYCTTGGNCINFTGISSIKIQVTLKNSFETRTFVSRI